MKEYIDEKTKAIKYDLFFSDKQIKTGYVENGTFVPFVHSRQVDKTTGEKMLMYRIALRDSNHREYRFQSAGLNSQPCFIQVPAASVRRKVKGLTSVYTVTTAWKDEWKLTVYSGDINAKSAWSGLKEQISLDALSQCLEYQSLEKDQSDPEKTTDKNPISRSEQSEGNVATFPQSDREIHHDEIDQFFPKINSDQAQTVENGLDTKLIPDTNKSVDLEKAVDLLTAQNQQLVQQVGELTAAMAHMMEQSAMISSRLNEAVECHQETKSIFSTVKGWLKQMTTRSQQVSKDVSEMKADVKEAREIKNPIKEHKER